MVKKFYFLILVFSIFLGQELYSQTKIKKEPIEVDFEDCVQTTKNSANVIPYRIELRNNTSKDYNLTLKIATVDYNDKIRKVNVEADVFLPQKGEKVIFMYEFISDSYSLYNKRSLIIESEREVITRKTVELSTVRENVIVVVTDLVSYTRGAFSIPTDLKTPFLYKSDYVYRTFIEAKNIPDSWIGLEWVDMIVLHDFHYDELTYAQKDALKNYCDMGGTLILIPSDSDIFFQNSFIQELCPIKWESQSMYKFPSLESEFGFIPDDKFIYFKITNAEIVDKEPPVLYVFNRGVGKIFVVPFNLAGPNFARWGGKSEFWGYIFDMRIKLTSELAIGKENYYWGYDYFSRHREQALRRVISEQTMISLSNVVDTINPYPSVTLISILILIYLILVGPINYIFLKKKGKIFFVALSVPLIAVLFSFLIIILSFFHKGTMWKYYSANLIEIVSGEERGRETCFNMILSPFPTTRDIDWDYDTSVYSISEGEPSFVKTSQSQNYIKFVDIPFKRWETKNFVSLRPQKLTGTISFSENEKEIKIYNSTNYELKDILYNEGEFIYKLGSVAPMDSFMFKLDENNKLMPYELHYIISETPNVKESLYDLLMSIIKYDTRNKYIVCKIDVPQKVKIDGKDIGCTDSLTMIKVYKK